MIYLDNAATTKISKNASERLLEFSLESFYNPSAIYGQGAYVKSQINSAKEAVANAIGTTFEDNIIFTSSATEANNLAILGSYKKNFGKMIFSYAEHPSVYNVALNLKNLGADVEFVKLQPNGEVDYSDLESKLNDSVSFISIMAVCNETGAINDLRRIVELKNKYCPNAIFHSDGVQAFGKIKINVNYFGVDLFTINAHKTFGPKGVGALYVRNKNILKPLLFGGGQEYNIRSSTENVPAIMAFKTAIEEIGNISKNYEQVTNCFNSFVKCLDLNFVKVNSFHSPYILSLSFKGVNGETLVHMMEEKDILISRGSACSSKKSGNRILENMGLTADEILGSVRVSFSKNTSIEEAMQAGNAIMQCYFDLKDKLR